MAHTMHRQDASVQDHREAVALLEEMAGCLRLPTNVVRKLAEKVTGKSWEELDIPGAEEVVTVLADLLDHSLARHPPPALEEGCPHDTGAHEAQCLARTTHTTHTERSKQTC